MGKTKSKPGDEKYLPGISFVISFPIHFSISSPLSMQKEFKKTFEGKVISPNKYLKEAFLNNFEVTNVQELYKKFPHIREYFTKKTKNFLKDEVAMNDVIFAKEMRKVMEKRIKECEVKE